MGEDILVGAPYDDTGSTDAGAVYVFDGETGDLIRTITNPSPNPYDYFGYSVAAVGTDIVVGAPYDDTGGTDAGAVYVFDGETGNLLYTVARPTPNAGDFFGYSVAAAETGIVVGAPARGETGIGKAYLFDLGGSGATLRQTFVSSQNGDRFGHSVAAAGSNIVIGAPWYNAGGQFRAGAAYLFDQEGDLLCTIANPNPGAYDYFGYSLAAADTKIAVGAQWDEDAGAVHLFALEIDEGTGEATCELLRTLNPAPWGGFGTSLTAFGSDFLVGAPWAGETEGGIVYLIDGDSFETLQTFEGSGAFGYSVAAVGVNILVSAPFGDGAAYVFVGEESRVPSVTLEAGHDLDGMVVRPAGRVDGGKADFVITAEDASAAQYGTYLVFGETLSEGVLELESTATHLDMTAMKGVGDLNRDGFDDVGAAVFEASDALEGDAQVQHQVVQVFFGKDDAADRFGSIPLYPDLVFEPDVFKTPDGALDPFVFAGVGFVAESDDTVVIDSGQAVVSTTGPWTVDGAVQSGEAREAELSFTWLFQGLDPDRSYNLRVSIPAAGDLNFALSRLARYEVSGDSLKTVLFDQQQAADLASQEIPTFYHLGTFRPDSEGNIRVTLKPEPISWPHPEALKDLTSGLPEDAFTGAPDENSASLGSGTVTYDFGDALVLDRDGADFLVYAPGSNLPTGDDPFALVDVLVSADGMNFMSVKASEQTLTGANGAVELGFASGQSATSVLTAAGTPSGGGITSFALTTDGVFAVTVNTDTYMVFLPRVGEAGTVDNLDLQGLVNDLNAAFASAPGTLGGNLGDVVSARASADGRLELYALNGTDTLEVTVLETAPQAVRAYSLDGSGLGAVRYIRIQGSEDAGEPGSGGLNVDAVAALQVAPAGSLVAGALELVEQGADLLVAEPQSGRSMVYLGHPLETVTPGDDPGEAPGPAKAAQPFRFEMATPLVTNGGSDAAQAGISLLDISPQAGDAFAFEGSASNELLSLSQPIGDINGDGADDLMLAGAEYAYILLGPVDLSGIENVAEAAAFSIDLSDLGQPAVRMGDVDGDGFSDLMFARSEGAQTIITVINGRGGLQWPRLLDNDSLGTLPAKNLYTITINSPAFGNADASLHALNWDGDGKADILVVSNQPVAGTVGYVFSGADLIAAQQNGQVLTQSNAAKRFTLSSDDSAGSPWQPSF
jgi:hypothetical protein